MALFQATPNRSPTSGPSPTQLFSENVVPAAPRSTRREPPPRDSAPAQDLCSLPFLQPLGVSSGTPGPPPAPAPPPARIRAPGPRPGSFEVQTRLPPTPPVPNSPRVVAPGWERCGVGLSALFSRPGSLTRWSPAHPLAVPVATRAGTQVGEARAARRARNRRAGVGSAREGGGDRGWEEEGIPLFVACSPGPSPLPSLCVAWGAGTGAGGRGSAQAPRGAHVGP